MRGVVPLFRASSLGLEAADIGVAGGMLVQEPRGALSRGLVGTVGQKHWRAAGGKRPTRGWGQRLS